MKHINQDEMCAACGVYERAHESRYCDGCRSAFAGKEHNEDP